jgi:RND superfamily putative drug exporter
MMFEKIANAVTKHYKLIIVIWIVALLASIPALMQVDKAVQYNTDFGSVDGYESLEAQKIIHEKFQSSGANGTLIGLLQDEDVTDASSRDFVLSLQDSIERSQGLKYYLDTSSVYTYYQGVVLEQAIPQLGASMRPVERSVGMTAFLLWGIPALHVNNYAGSGDDAAAYAATSAELSSYLTSVQADANTTMMAFGYYNAFAAAWNGTAAITDPVARAITCVNNVAPTVIGSLPADQNETKALMIAVLNNFDLTTFNNQLRDPFLCSLHHRDREWHNNTSPSSRRSMTSVRNMMRMR